MANPMKELTLDLKTWFGSMEERRMSSKWLWYWYNDNSTEDHALTARQKQLLYECEEERMVVKACMRDLVKLKKSVKHTSWDTAEAANMSLSWRAKQY